LDLRARSSLLYPYSAARRYPYGGDTHTLHIPAHLPYDLQPQISPINDTTHKRGFDRGKTTVIHSSPPSLWSRCLHNPFPIPSSHSDPMRPATSTTAPWNGASSPTSPLWPPTSSLLSYSPSSVWFISISVSDGGLGASPPPCSSAA
jgi:hypothetical protein